MFERLIEPNCIFYFFLQGKKHFFKLMCTKKSKVLSRYTHQPNMNTPTKIWLYCTQICFALQTISLFHNSMHHTSFFLEVQWKTKSYELMDPVPISYCSICQVSFLVSLLQTCQQRHTGFFLIISPWRKHLKVDLSLYSSARIARCREHLQFHLHLLNK